MELTFLGLGSSFNTKLNNNSCFYKENNNLLLIDCGETIFKCLIENNILNDIKNIYVFITHTHSDHIGSLSSLISYMYYQKNTKLNIVLDKNCLHKKNVINILKLSGTDKDKYNIINANKINKIFKEINKVYYKETEHSKSLHCYSIIFETNKGVIFYSGDTKNLKVLNELINKNTNFYKIYLDTNSIDNINSIHVCIKEINKLPESIKQLVYCMHINNDECLELVKKYNYKLPKKVGDNKC